MSPRKSPIVAHGLLTIISLGWMRHDEESIPRCEQFTDCLQGYNVLTKPLNLKNATEPES
jgi:hypothetical protein